MTHTPEGQLQQVPDLTLAEACPVCTGPLVIRTSLAGGRSFCTGCGWLARVHLRLRGNQVELAFPTVADA